MIKKYVRNSSYSKDDSSFLSNASGYTMKGTIEKSGWLQKWTNYLKGYRDRWFVLDSDGYISYYRNQSEVGVVCRGSLNLSEASIHSPSNLTLTVTKGSQNFHLKAVNERDKTEWLNALEYAKHRAIKRTDSDNEDDDANDIQDVTGKINTTAVEEVIKTVNLKLSSVEQIIEEIEKQSRTITECLLHVNVEHNSDAIAYSQASAALNESLKQLVQTSKELNDFTSKKYRWLASYANNEHIQRINLREVLETLAKQHSRLERDAMTNANIQPSEQPPYVDPLAADDDEEFHDAMDKMDFNGDAKSGGVDADTSVGAGDGDHESSGSRSRQLTSCEESDTAILNADVLIDRMTESASSYTAPASNGNRIYDEKYKVDDLTDTVDVEPPPNVVSTRRRRDVIPERLQSSLSLWSFMRNCIGKELTKIPLPVNFNEPLSMCQRLTEDLEYAYLLDRAAEKTDFCEQACYVAAYAVTCYSTTGNRTTKPFNPLLGETYEFDRSEDLGWRSLTEQVSHHPPATAHHAEGKQWTMFQEFSLTSRFRGKYLSVTPQGYTHVVFENSGNHYTYNKITTTVHNIIVGRLWIDNSGDMIVQNHTTGDKCVVKFHSYSYFSSEKPRRINGMVKDRHGVVRYMLQGYWDHHIDIMRVTKQEKLPKLILETQRPRRIWTINPPHKPDAKLYFFTKFAIELNEPDDSVAPTDSRNRVDQRLMENGQWDEANKAKCELEEKQRMRKRQQDAEAELAMKAGLPIPEYTAKWFDKKQDECTGSVIHLFKGDYWSCKKAKDWSRCPSIY